MLTALLPKYTFFSLESLAHLQSSYSPQDHFICCEVTCFVELLLQIYFPRGSSLLLTQGTAGIMKPIWRSLIVSPKSGHGHHSRCSRGSCRKLGSGGLGKARPIACKGSVVCYQRLADHCVALESLMHLDKHNTASLALYRGFNTFALSLWEFLLTSHHCSANSSVAVI